MGRPGVVCVRLDMAEISRLANLALAHDRTIGEEATHLLVEAINKA